MGVDISHIVRHNFRQVEDAQASLDFAKETIENLKEKLFIKEDFSLTQDSMYTEYAETIFQVPLYDVEFTLHNGFWQIESYYHYCQIVMHQGDYFWLRRMIFDIVNALGESEAWHAEEYHTWNREGGDNPEITFEQWTDYILKEMNGTIPEFNQREIMAQGDVHIPNYESIYHDSFKECFEIFDTIQSRIQNYRLLGICRIGQNFLRCVKNNGLFLINEETLKPLFDKPIDSVQLSLNGPEFVVQNNGLSAVFDKDGTQLTEFVEGVFKYKRTPHQIGCEDKRIIYNEIAGIELEPR